MTDGNGNGFSNKEILLRLEAKVDAVLADHEVRLRSMERWRDSLKGAARLGGLAFAVVSPVAAVLALILT